MSDRRRSPSPRPPSRKRKSEKPAGSRIPPSRRTYNTADLARWFRVSIEEIRAWIAASARPTPSGWVVVLDQMVGHRRRKRLPWRFTMMPRGRRRGTSRPPTAARRARKAGKVRPTDPPDTTRGR